MSGVTFYRDKSTSHHRAFRVYSGDRYIGVVWQPRRDWGWRNSDGTDYPTRADATRALLSRHTYGTGDWTFSEVLSGRRM